MNGEATTQGAVRPGLGQRALRASFWVVGGRVASQAIRLASNLILTRLLFPEAFGLMAVVNVWLVGLQMMSDLGIGPSVIQSRRGDEPAFLDTLWTAQVIRGFVLAGLACAAALPSAAFYDQPALAGLLPAAGLSALFGGFASTRLFTQNRALALGRLTALELGAQVAGVVVMVVWAWLVPTVWALVGGALTASGLRALGSHVLLPGARNRLHWDPEAIRELVRFGKWIFFTSMTNFLASQGDRLLLASLIPFATLGVYTVAFFLAEAPAQIVSMLQRRVLLPAFSEVARDDVARLREVYYRARLRIELLVLPAAFVLILAGPEIIRVLYDDRYLEAGWMLQVLALRLLVGVPSGPAQICLTALGEPRYMFLCTSSQALWLFGLAPFAMRLGGLPAVIAVIAGYGVLALGVVLVGLSGHGLLSLHRELRWAGAAALTVALALGVRALGWIQPLGAFDVRAFVEGLF